MRVENSKVRSNPLIQIRLHITLAQVEGRNAEVAFLKYSNEKEPIIVTFMNLPIRSYHIFVFMVNFWTLKTMAGHLKA